MSTPDTSLGDETLDEILLSLRLDATVTNDQQYLIKQFAEAKDRLNRLMLQARIDEVKNCREGFVIGYQRYEGNEAADKFLRTVIEAFDERIAAIDAQLNKE